MSLAFEELRDLLVVLNQTDIAELTLKEGEFELTVRKAVAATGVTGIEVTPAALIGAGASVPAPITPPVVPQPTPVVPTPEAIAPPPTAPPAAPPAREDPNLVAVLSPMVGTFYRAPAPGEAPFVKVGDRIQTGQTVCIIEAMKLMNELEAEVSGEVVEILAENGQPVEFDQPLMRVRADS